MGFRTKSNPVIHIGPDSDSGFKYASIDALSQSGYSPNQPVRPLSDSGPRLSKIFTKDKLWPNLKVAWCSKPPMVNGRISEMIRIEPPAATLLKEKPKMPQEVC